MKRFSLLLLRFLDHQLIDHYAPLLEAMNTQLAREGVLPELTFVPIFKSHAAMISNPAPRQKPCTFAMTGTGTWRNASQAWWTWVMNFWRSRRSPSCSFL